jgi:nitroreductase
MDSLAQRLPYAKMLTEAAAAIIVCGDLSVLSKEGKPSTNWTFDCSAATENLLLMAEAMGLGAVWTGVHPYEDRLSVVKAALGLPEHIVPLNVVPIGYPKGTPQPKDKFDAANIHYNRW